MKFYSKIAFFIAVFLFGVVSAGGTFVYAQPLKSKPADVGSGDSLEDLEKVSSENQERVKRKKAHYYERPTMRKLSMLYWALGALDIDNPSDIDNYLLINECDIFKTYYGREFEWRKVRDSGRDFIEENIKNFPLRFSITLPLQLGNYDFKSQRFYIYEPYQIKGIRRFEVRADDARETICGMRYGYKVPGYPKGIILKLTRPLTFLSLPVPPELAQDYIDKKMAFLGRHILQKGNKVREARDAYLVLNVKFFSADEKDIYIKSTPYKSLMGVLENIQVYADQSRDMLLYEENFRKRKKRSLVEQEMKREFERRKAELERLNILGRDETRGETDSSSPSSAEKNNAQK